MKIHAHTLSYTYVLVPATSSVRRVLWLMRMCLKEKAEAESPRGPVDKKGAPPYARCVKEKVGERAQQDQLLQMRHAAQHALTAAAIYV